MSAYFEGLYFKHISESGSLALIPGRSEDESFIQVVTEAGAWQAVYPLSAYERTKSRVRVGDSLFTDTGLSLRIETPRVRLIGTLSYGALTPLRGHIMGPFRFLPMECRHEVRSLYHSVDGQVEMGGALWDFSGGRGYIEGDKGRSFPSGYAWAQCTFPELDASVMASAARIPFPGGAFTGCIAAVLLGGRQYKIATYLGGKAHAWGDGILDLGQGGRRLLIETRPRNRQQLRAPVRGHMSRVIHESLCCEARIRFYDKGRLLLDETSHQASFEYVE